MDEPTSQHDASTIIEDEISTEGGPQGGECIGKESFTEEDFSVSAERWSRSINGTTSGPGASRYRVLDCSNQPHMLISLIDIAEGGWRWMRTAPIFLVLLVSSTLAIFNYQKSSSSVISSTMYALRTSPQAREYLGDDIYFAHKMPWIWGEMNQLKGRIDIQFSVKGTKNSGMMRFTSNRPTRMGMFETTEWSLETQDGEKIDLLDGDDPFKALLIEDAEEKKVVGRGSYAPNLSG